MGDALKKEIEGGRVHTPGHDFLKREIEAGRIKIPTITVTTTFDELGAWVQVDGGGFTPESHVSITYESVPGRTAPFSGMWASVESDGTFGVGQEVHCTTTDASLPPATVRATSNNGDDATAETDAFNCGKR